MQTLAALFKRVSYNASLMYALRMAVAFTGTAFFPYLIDRQILTIPLTLGVVAAGISNIDDRFTVHLRNLVYTFIGFFIAASSVQLLFPYPFLFALGLIISCAVLILLGSLGPRYATISYGSLVVGVYAMLGVHLFDNWYQQALYLVAGAVWYGFLTSISYLVFPVRKLENNLSACYDKLGTFLYAKSNLFDADLDNDEFEKALIELSLCNSKLVAILNLTRMSLLGRLKGDRGQQDTRRSLHYYFVAQDIHERGDSAHSQYQNLATTFRHSDILFRFQRLLSMQSRACAQLAKCIRLHRPYLHNPRFKRAFDSLKQSIDNQFIAVQLTATQVSINSNSTNRTEQLNALLLILSNLKEIDAQLANMQTERAMLQNKLDDKNNDKNFDSSDINLQLRDDSLHGIDDIWQRIKQNLNPESVLFRHAIRLSIVLLVTYIFIQITDLTYGYWILLTALFVSQPNFNATQRRLKLRIIGTIAGVLAGLPILYFVPSIEGQLIVLIIAGVLFFELRSQQYAQATAFITLLALISFNLEGSGFDAVIPRITDTLIGCLFAWLGVTFIWPDWKFRRLPRLIERNVNAQCGYLMAVISQYKQGKNNDIDYRIKRRAAHNADAELASFISTLSTEPDQDAIQLSQCFRLLCLSHTFLSYISALGAHRALINDPQTMALLDQVEANIKDALLHAQMPRTQLKKVPELDQITHSLTEQPKPHPSEQLVMQQIQLLMSVLTEYATLNQSLSYDDHSDESALAAL